MLYAGMDGGWKAVDHIFTRRTQPLFATRAYCIKSVSGCSVKCLERLQEVASSGAPGKGPGQPATGSAPTQAIFIPSLLAENYTAPPPRQNSRGEKGESQTERGR